MSLVRLGRYYPGKSFAASQDGVENFKNVKEMISSGCNAFLLEAPDASDALLAAETVRRTPAVSFCPLFSKLSGGKRFESLCDGVVSSHHEAAFKAGDMLVALSEVNREALLKNSNFRLLAWFYMRRGIHLTPIVLPNSDAIYSYPLAECMADDGLPHQQWLDDLRVLGQIEQGGLVDRLRICPKCSSPHLNFIDVCPDCGSIDITSKELVHCFTCGRVGLMEKFLRENSMTCPYCKTRLRHLGSDYDHPMENFVCNDCSNTCTEPEVVVICHSCGNRSPVDDLGVTTYFKYRLTEKGRISARVGEMESAYALFDRLGNVSYSYFEQFLDWNLNLMRRYGKESDLTILAVRFDNIEEIADAVGGPKMAQLIDALTSRLKEILRVTDVVMRSSIGTLYFLLPHTSGEQTKTVTSKVYSLSDQVVLENAPRLRISIAARTLPESADSVCRERNAKEILANISSNITYIHEVPR